MSSGSRLRATRPAIDSPILTRGVASQAAAAHGDDAQVLVVVDQHHGPGRAAQEIEGVGEDRVEDLVEVEDGVEGLAGVEQRRVHLQALGHRGVEDTLVDEEAAEPVEVDLLLDRVDAEAETERRHRGPQDPGPAGDQLEAGRTSGDEAREPEDDDDDDREEPQLHAPPLDHLDRGRALLAQACNPGFVPDSLTDLHRELVHGSSRAAVTIRTIGALRARLEG